LAGVTHADEISDPIFFDRSYLHLNIREIPMNDKWLRVLVLFFIAGLVTVGNGLQPTYATLASDSETHAAIDAYIEERIQALKIPGAALAIVQGDQIEYLQGYGVADSAGREITPQTPFMLASVSKSFTALAIMQLAEEGRLDLDAPVREYLPWFQIADESAASEMTVRQLLYQTSGFSETDGNRINLDTNMAEDALSASMKRLTRTELIHAPGTAFEYSNINYGLLGAIVETVSGESFESYIQQNIFAPLEMEHSYTSMSEAEAGGATHGTYPFFGLPVRYDQMMPYSRAVTPWAGLFSSAEDLAHYLIAHLNEGGYQGNAILPPEGVSQLHSPGVEVNQWTSYAMGWWINPNFDLASQDQSDRLSSYAIPVVISHEGSWAAFRTVALMVPGQKVGVVLLMNTNDPAIESAFGSLGWDVLLLYLGKEPMYYPPFEDFILQNARPVFTVVTILLLGSFLWFVRKLRSWRQSPVAAPSAWKMIAGYLLLPLAFDLLLAWFLLAVQLPDARATVPSVVRMAPDLGLLLILILLFTLGWGTLRTLLLSQILFRKAARKQESPSQEPGLGQVA
jgi:CubicO group peptidase (beta-lactamase class C family)